LKCQRSASAAKKNRHQPGANSKKNAVE
jgi:hypothetical protein